MRPCRSFVTRLAFRLHNLAIRFKLPRVMAVALACIGRLNSIGNGEYTVLCIGKTVFLDDLKNMVRYSGKIRYVVIWKGFFSWLLSTYFPAEPIPREENYYNEHNAEGRKNAYAFLDKMFPLFKRLLGFDAILSPNIGYTEQQELCLVSEKHNVPFIVLLKEGTAAMAQLKFAFAPLKHKRFDGSAILFYNENIKNIYTAHGPAGLEKARKYVVGAPRIDYYVRERETWDVVPNQILFYSFYMIIKKVPQCSDPETWARIVRHAEEFHRMVMELALRHPEYTVVIKTKPTSAYIEYVQEILNQHFPDEQPPNLRVTWQEDPIDLLAKSQVIITYNSTTVIEAVLAGKAIITPFAKDDQDVNNLDFFADFPGISEHAASYEELEAAVERSMDGVRYGDLALPFLHAYVYQPDGRASQRAENAIIETIERRKSASGGDS